MRSPYVCFPAPNLVDVRDEDVAPPKEGELLCRATRSLISIGTELHCLRGSFDPGTNWAAWVTYPFRPGYSMAARVVQAGPGVSGFRSGDRVTSLTSHALYFCVPADRVQRIPPGVSDEDATWAQLACTTQIALRRAQLQLGESVGVVGLGILGQLIVQYLALSGARRIVAIDTAAARLEFARAHGATHVVGTNATSARQRVAQLTDGRMLDVVWDVTGHPASLAPSVLLLRKLGRLVLVGDTPLPTQQHLGPGVVSNSIAILGVHGMSSAPTYSEHTPWPREEMIALFFDYLAQGRMRVADLVTHVHSPLDAPQVYPGLLNDRSAALGVLFDWTLLD